MKSFTRIRGTKVINIVQLRPLDEVEREHVLSVYERCNFDGTRTCAVLQISRQTLYRRLERYASEGHIKWPVKK